MCRGAFNVLGNIKLREALRDWSVTVALNVMLQAGWSNFLAKIVTRVCGQPEVAIKQSNK